MRRRRITTRAALTCLATALLCGVSAGPAVAAEPVAHIEGVEVNRGKVELTLATSDLPPDVSLDLDSVMVTADGAELDVRANPQGRARAAVDGSARGVVMLVDTSGSMSADIAAAREAARNYVRSLPLDVRAGLITFSDRPALDVALTGNRVALIDGLRGLTAQGATSLYDAVQLGVSTLDRLDESAQRRIVVLSDGEDTSSRISLDEAAELLAEENVTADIVAFRYGSGDTSSVRVLAEAGGGRVLHAEDAGQLTAAFTEMARRFTERTVVSAAVPSELSGETVTLSVTARTTDGGTLSASEEITFAGGLAWWFSTWMPTWTWQLWIVLGLAFFGVLLTSLLLFGVGRRVDAGQSVLDQLARYGPRREVGGAQQEGSVAHAALGWAEQVLRSRGWEEKLAERLDLAGLTIKPAEWTLLRGCGVVVASGLLLLLGLNFFIAIALAVPLVVVGTLMYVKIRIAVRRARFSDQLPDVLQLVAGSLNAGFSLAQALDAVVREGMQPGSGEFSRALAATRIGIELEDALDQVARRMASDDLSWIVMAIRIQREVGGNLAEVLLTNVTTMRERAQSRRQVRALSAEGRLSAYVLLGLPVALGGYLFLVRPEYMQPLYTTGFGLLMVAGSLVFMTLGAFWMRQLIKVEV